MKEREDKNGDKDRHLDIPAEASRDKHINFLDDTDLGSGGSRYDDKDLKERQKQWKEGLEEGQKARNND